MQPLTLRWLFPLTLVVLLLPACSDGADDVAATTTAPTTTVIETTATAPSTTQPATTTTLDPDALILGERLSVPEVSSTIGTGAVTFDQAPNASLIVATMDGTVPVVDPAGDSSFCQFCVPKVRLTADSEVPIALFADRPIDAYGELGWTIASEDGTVNAHFAIVEDPATGINVMKDPPEIESFTVVADIDIPLESLTGGPSLVAGPNGCVLELVEGGLVLREGSARLVLG
jgi:hypothetical protein